MKVFFYESGFLMKVVFTDTGLYIIIALDLVCQNWKPKFCPFFFVSSDLDHVSMYCDNETSLELSYRHELNPLHHLDHRLLIVFNLQQVHVRR